MGAFGGIEAGGTKFVCAIGDAPGRLRARAELPTTTPTETIARAVAFFHEHQNGAPLQAIGIGSFGPIDAHVGSPTWGHITTTPKLGWQNVDVAGEVRRALDVPVAFDTDVNVAGLGEHRWGAAQGLDTFLYLTFGTGIGGGGLANGRMMHGLIHPEVGHMRLPHDWQADPFPGVCPFHGDCLEGLASGPALKQRWGQPAEQLPDDHPAWPLQARYVALGLVNLICAVSPQRIVCGGGTMRPVLFPLIRREVQSLLNGYVRHATVLDHIDEYIVPPALGNDAGVLGAIALAQDEARSGLAAPSSR